ncbi:alpha/beta fold hydrolase [Pseudomonas abietaniphila]|uniref:Pimeloyl-ACP methyl ester carboxylesterase n=1 Tax=Pseudomonas abietaniphila TaxID=89065 RepID=A0A1G8F8J6_9PSED|nr:alpha/beta hydrolase [Pseudomonas abietaniphila]SDH78420.1 Pimeloyl-ACP methyl ester carboxylesterase [Pseudomonas abietaniphila]
MSTFTLNRRHFLTSSAAGVAAFALSDLTPAMAAYEPVEKKAAVKSSGTAAALGPIKQVTTDVLDIGYYEAGPEDGRPVVLLHGFPYDIHSYVEVAPILAAQGMRVIVPHLRGHGSTTFLDKDTPRSGQQAAIGQDVLDLITALHIPEAVFAGFGWGGRAACVAAALKPSRCVGLVSVNSYLIQDIAKASEPLSAQVEWGLWYQHYFQTARGRAGLQANRREMARLLWKSNSPTWRFDDATFERSAASFDNPDYVDVVIHSYRHRMGLAPGAADYEEIEKKLAQNPPISARTITLDGMADGVIAATDGTSSAAHFIGTREHRQIPDVGHNLPQEAPQAFADAVAALVRSGKWRT